MLEGRAAIGYDHGYNLQKLYLGLALDPDYIEGFGEGCLEKMGEDDQNEGEFLRDLWEEGDDRQFVLDTLKGECEVRPG